MKTRLYKLTNKQKSIFTIIFWCLLTLSIQAAWTQQANDTFTGSAGLLTSHTPDSGSGTWSVSGAGTISLSGTGTLGTGTDFALDNTTLQAMQRVDIDITDRNNSPLPSILLGFSSGNATGYCVKGDAFGTNIYRFDNSGIAKTSIKSDSTSWSNGDTISLRTDGSGNLTVWRNGTQISGLNVSDSTYTTGYGGLGDLSLGQCCDNWVAYDDTGGGGATQYLFPPTLTGIGGPGLFLAPWIH